MSVRSVIFDWDNTLVNTWEMTQDIVNHVRVQFGLDAWDLEQIKSSTHLSAKDVFPLWFKDQADDAFQCLKQYVINGQVEQFEKLSPICGAEDLLIYLKENNIPCAIFSNKQGERLRLEVEYMGWTHYFEGIYGSLDFPFDKPNPYGAEQILKNHNFDAQTTWFIGDTIVDWQCAQQSGCTPIKIGNGACNLPIESFIDCSAILERISAG